MKACESGNVDMVRHLLAQPEVKDFEGPDGLNALTISIGQLDPTLVLLTATPETQTKAPPFLCDIIHELDREIQGEKSENKKDKMMMLRSTLLRYKTQKKFCNKPSCDKISTPKIDKK